VYDWLLFLHVLLAFSLVVTVVMFTAFALGAPLTKTSFAVANAFWGLGAIGSLVFGIALVFDVDGYGFLDGWILGAIVLWAIATELGRRAQLELTPIAEGGAESTVSGADVAETAISARRAAMWHWLRALTVLALLVLMIYKPGA
jgi:hypothetical protein